MKAGFVQFCPVFGERDDNLRKSLALMDEVDADLLVLPELCTTGYAFTSKDEAAALAEPVPDGPSSQAWLKLAADKQMAIVAGIAEKAGDKVYNSAALLKPDGDVNIYRKAHLFHKEKLWFAPGDTAFCSHDIGRAQIGMMICFDWIFPESARLLSLNGAQVLCHPANLVLPYCPAAMITRCLENRVFAITCNRTGSESRGDQSFTFIGQSQVVSPRGEVLVRATETEEAVHTVEIDPAEAASKVIVEGNDLFADRRTALYGKLIE